MLSWAWALASKPGKHRFMVYGVFLNDPSICFVQTHCTRILIDLSVVDEHFDFTDKAKLKCSLFARS